MRHSELNEISSAPHFPPFGVSTEPQTLGILFSMHWEPIAKGGGQNSTKKFFVWTKASFSSFRLSSDEKKDEFLAVTAATVFIHFFTKMPSTKEAGASAAAEQKAPAAGKKAAEKAAPKAPAKAVAKPMTDKQKAAAAKRADKAALNISIAAARKKIKEKKLEEADEWKATRRFFSIDNVERLVVFVDALKPKGGPTQEGRAICAREMNNGATGDLVGKYNADNCYNAWMRWVKKGAVTGNNSDSREHKLRCGRRRHERRAQRRRKVGEAAEVYRGGRQRLRRRLVF